MITRLSLLTTALAAALPAFAATGPSSSTTPYLTPVDPGVEFTSILTTGDTVRLRQVSSRAPVGTYRMAGIPDGLGAWDNDDGTLTVLMNHELGSSVGVARAHGGKGAFVSRWQIRKSDLKVLSGQDLIEKVNLWNGNQFVATPDVVFNRFCSADLAPTKALFNRKGGKGYREGRIFFSGEETSGGRAFAHIASGREAGTSYQIPGLGTAAWENIAASPFEQDTTVLMGMDDGSLNASKLFVYVGTKQRKGSALEQAGLAGGTRYEVSIDGFTTESPAINAIPNGYSGRFSMVTSGGTGLNRVEDGAWDTKNPNRFYFVTTANITGNSRLWRVTFDDIGNPAAGGNVEVLVDGAVTGQKMMDNITVDGSGAVYMQEDVGNNAHIGKIWRYATDGSLTLIAQHDADRFITGASADIDGTDAKQSDEESSGIIEITQLLGDDDNSEHAGAAWDIRNYRYFLLDVQAHYASVDGVPVDAALVEGGQLLLMQVPR